MGVEKPQRLRPVSPIQLRPTSPENPTPPSIGGDCGNDRGGSVANNEAPAGNAYRCCTRDSPCRYPPWLLDEGDARARSRVVQPGASESLLATKLGDLLVDRSLEHGWAAENIWALLDVVADVADVDEHRLALSCHSRAARNPSLLALSPHLAVEMHVRMLYVLTPASDVSVWTTSAGGGLQSTAHAGGGEPTRRARLVARDLLDGSAPALGLFTSIPVLRWQRTEAALVVKSEKEWRQTAALAAEDIAAALTPVLEREALSCAGCDSRASARRDRRAAPHANRVRSPRRPDSRPQRGRRRYSSLQGTSR